MSKLVHYTTEYPPCHGSQTLTPKGVDYIANLRPRTVDSRFLVLRGSEYTISEITKYTYFSPMKPRNGFKYKSE